MLQSSQYKTTDTKYQTLHVKHDTSQCLSDRLDAMMTYQQLLSVTQYYTHSQSNPEWHTGTETRKFCWAIQWLKPENTRKARGKDDYVLLISQITRPSQHRVSTVLAATTCLSTPLHWAAQRCFIEGMSSYWGEGVRGWGLLVCVVWAFSIPQMPSINNWRGCAFKPCSCPHLFPIKPTFPLMVMPATLRLMTFTSWETGRLFLELWVSGDSKYHIYGWTVGINVHRGTLRSYPNDSVYTTTFPPDMLNAWIQIWSGLAPVHLYVQILAQ